MDYFFDLIWPSEEPPEVETEEDRALGEWLLEGAALRGDFFRVPESAVKLNAADLEGARQEAEELWLRRRYGEGPDGPEGYVILGPDGGCEAVRYFSERQAPFYPHHVRLETEGQKRRWEQIAAKLSDIAPTGHQSWSDETPGITAHGFRSASRAAASKRFIQRYTSGLLR